MRGGTCDAGHNPFDRQGPAGLELPGVRFVVRLNYALLRAQVRDSTHVGLVEGHAPTAYPPKHARAIVWVQAGPDELDLTRKS